MGTNFYKIIPVKKRIKDILKEKIDREGFTVDKYGNVTIDDTYDLNLEPNEIHIGKRSGGWKFLFDYNEWKYFNNTEKSLLEWIYDTSNDAYIKDEYGIIYTPDEFMKEVNETYDTPWLNGQERWDGFTYYTVHPNEYYRGVEEEYVGKYRVSLFTDFS